MDAPKPATNGKHNASWLRGSNSVPSRAATRFGLRLKTPRPIISEPIGPIINSRGPDFSRAENLLIVDGIKDCVSPPRGSKLQRLSAARFPIESVQGKPTVAKSTVTAFTRIKAPLSRKSINETTFLSPPKPARPHLQTSSTFGLLPTYDALQNDENTPPDDEIPKPKSNFKSRLPKSQTMNVLHNLKASISRSSLNAWAGGSDKIQESTQGSSSPINTLPSSPSSMPLMQVSSGSVTGASTRSTEPEFWQISEAQSSSYWSGRFMSLYDRFMAEALTPIPPGAAPSTEPQSHQRFVSTPNQGLDKTRGSHLPLSATTSALPQAPRPPRAASRRNDDEERTRRVFLHLESLCCTDEARISLFEWQRAYTERQRRPKTKPKPQGKEANTGGLVSRLLSGAQKAGRRSLSNLRDPNAPMRKTRVGRQ